ncbi:uncharacterized protein KPYH43_c3614 [Klebsiella pneumoniae]|nr:uncharacterized protein KPYH43_c3614 [Klebsiella pneumoniae]
MPVKYSGSATSRREENDYQTTDRNAQNDSKYYGVTFFEPQLADENPGVPAQQGCPCCQRGGIT